MSKIRFFKVSSFYSEYLVWFCKQHPTLSSLSYDDQLKSFVNDCYGWADFWKINLEKTGYYDVFECFTNAESLQKQWAKEHDFKFSEQNWSLEILVQQISEFKPHILFINNFFVLGSSFTKIIKKQCPEIKLIIGWDGSNINDPEKFEDCDLILSCTEDITHFYSTHGFKVYLFQFGFEKSILSKLTPAKKKYKLSFVGSLFLGQELHDKRFHQIADLAKRTQLNIFSSNHDSNWQPYKYPQRQRIYHGRFKEFWDIYNIGRKWKGEAYGLKMYNILANSKITINSHGDKVHKAANMRLFESTGAGSCLVTDWKSNLHELFEIDKEVIAYKSIEECIEKIKWLLANEKELEAIAKAGQRRTLENYSFEIRIKEFSNFLLKQI